MRILLIIIGITFSLTSYCQNNSAPLSRYNELSEHKGSEIFKIEPSAVASVASMEEDWQISFKTFTEYKHKSDISSEEFDRLKMQAHQKRNSYEKINQSGQINKKSTLQSPVMFTNYEGNKRGNSIPMDNTLGVSNNGVVVSAINNNLIFADAGGNITATKTLREFFVYLGLSGSMFDPRIIFDTEWNRFIVVCLHGSNPQISQVCLAFSLTEDPNGEWAFYKIKGDLLNEKVWFDYPNISLNKHELFIMGNMFSSENGFQYSMILQIDKVAGYAAKTIEYKYYDRVNNLLDGRAFNPIPVMQGWHTYNEGMQFINQAFNGFTLHTIQNTLKNNPQLTTEFIRHTEQTEFPPNARQKGSDILLQTGGDRIQTAVNVNNIIHFSANSASVTGEGALFYGRINLQNKSITSTIIEVPGKDLAYPVLSFFSNNETSDTMLITYTFSGPDHFPGLACMMLAGRNNIFNKSEEFIVKNGESRIIFGNNGEVVRWGDYSGCSRRFVKGRVETWVTGTYGAFSGHFTWIGQILSPSFNKSFLSEFIASPSSTQKQLPVTFTNTSNIKPDSLLWLFPHGNPETSKELNPTVIYNDEGKYDVTMISWYGNEIDTFQKKDYINIYQPMQPPVADWAANKNIIFVGDSIIFEDVSEGFVVNRSWTFQNGIPNKSVERSPVVFYGKKGEYLVSLTVNNFAGSNTKTQNRSILVRDTIAPMARFDSDLRSIAPGDSIHFINKSIDGVSYEWTFEGGTPQTSTEISPTIRYDEKGIYKVKLRVENEFGVDSITTFDWVIVESSSVIDESKRQKQKLYPNPTQRGSVVTLEFDNNIEQECTIDISDISGALIKNLHAERLKVGKSLLSFNTEQLPKGTYVISINMTNETNYSILQVVD